MAWRFTGKNSAPNLQSEAGAVAMWPLVAVSVHRGRELHATWCAPYAVSTPAHLQTGGGPWQTSHALELTVIPVDGVQIRR